MSHRGPVSSGGYGISPNPYGSGQTEEASGGFLDQIRPYTSKVEDLLDSVSEPIKP